MFSGIVEAMAQVVRIDTEGTNKHFTLRSPFSDALGIDQSIAHNGVCLTVVRHEDDLYTVTAMQETLRLTNLSDLKVGDWVNLEKAMSVDDMSVQEFVRGQTPGRTYRPRTCGLQGCLHRRGGTGRLMEVHL